MNPARPLFYGLILMPLSALAGTSTNYTLAPDTVDTGGFPGASTNYTVNSSSTPGGAGSSINYAARTGYAGQLFDATALTLAAPTLTVNEGGASQLSVTLLYDDGTIAALPATSVSWSVQSGPLTGINTSGLATAATVYQDTAAVARGTYQTLTGTLNLTVLNILPDNFGSYAGDGLPDDWQVQYFGINNPNAGPLLDPDRDSWNNLFEYNAAIIPTDPVSTFSMSIMSIAGGGHQVTFSPRFPQCTYTLMGSSNLTVWSPVAGTITDAGTIRTILDPLGTGARRFYFIQVLRQ